MSHARAASLAATRSFVTPASAETTTIGNCTFRSATMSIAFATRCASPTEVPPNLTMIMTRCSLLVLRCSCGVRSAQHEQRATKNEEPSQQAPRLEQLRIQDRRAGRAANRVVHQRDHAQIQQRTGAQPPDRDAHPALAIAIEPRLRAIVTVDVVQRLTRRRRQMQMLRLPSEIVDRLAHLIEI